MRATRHLDLEVGRVRHRLLEEQAGRCVVIATIAIVNRRSHNLTVLVKEDPESIVLASLMGGDIDVQVERLAGRY